MKIIFATYIRLAKSLQKPWEEVVIFIPGSRPYAGFPLTGYHQCCLSHRLLPSIHLLIKYRGNYGELQAEDTIVEYPIA